MTATHETPPSPWLNRTVVGAGLTSFLADMGYEMATAILPAFLRLLQLPLRPATPAQAIVALGTAKKDGVLVPQGSELQA